MERQPRRSARAVPESDPNAVTAADGAGSSAGPDDGAHVNADASEGDAGGDAQADAAGEAADKREQSWLSFLRELPVLLLVAFLLAFLLRTFVVQVFYIPSSSMEPTLQINDRMVVEKLSYRFRDPRRGEILVFEGDPVAAPASDSALQRAIRGVGQFLGIVPANARDFVKRVIGLPGDVVTIEDGVVSVNGVALDEPYVRFEDGRSSGPYVVPEGHLFFLGDNRPNSSDSRFSLGFVDEDRVVGRAMVILWPVNHFEMLGGADYDAIPDDPPPGLEAEVAASAAVMAPAA